MRSNKFNLRTLLKIKEKKYANNRTLKIKGKTVFVNDFISVPVFDFLKTMFGSIEELEGVIFNLTVSDIKSYEKDICIGLIALSDYENNDFSIGEHNYSDSVKYTLENPNFPDLIQETHNFWINYKTQVNTLEILKNAFVNYKNHFL